MLFIRTPLRGRAGPPLPPPRTPFSPGPAPSPAGKKSHEKRGIRRPADLVTHLPLRYEDRTRLTPLADIVPGVACQIEGTVTSTKAHFRPRRQLVTLLAHGDAQALLRFLNFYPSQQKTLAVGQL